MSASAAEAIPICSSILDNGSRNVDVYWKLSSAQFQNGQTEQANKTLENALRLHPGNSKLEALKKILSTETNEQALIARSSRLNQNSLDKGAMKIACLTKSGQEAVSACRRRLELTDEDGERMRARLAKLNDQLANTVIANAPSVTPASVPTTPSRNEVAPRTVTTLSNPANEQSEPKINTPSTAALIPNNAATLAVQERKQAYKALVINVQTQLNEIGLSAGVPDGVPGTNTRKALSAFYSAIGEQVNTTISERTLEDLNTQKFKLGSAERLLSQSNQALQQGNILLAKQQLAQARSTSALLSVPLQFENELRKASAAAMSVATEPATDRTKLHANAPTVTDDKPAPTVATEPVQAPTISANPQQFADLMGRINTLQNMIRQKQADQTLQMDRIRNSL